jgi:uncharacterized RDD family membrane protein YckC
MFSGLAVTPLLDFKDPPLGRRCAGFWRRLLALAIDAILISVPCYALGAAFYTFFSGNPFWSALSGFVITLPYFAIMSSSLRQGQTIGHRFMQIQVVREDGTLIPLRTSALRYFILLAPVTLAADMLPSRLPSTLVAVFQILMSGTDFAICYLYLFNRRTRQSLHDLATNTFVVDAPGFGGVSAPRFWSWHWVILGGILLTVVGLVEVVAPKLMTTETFSELDSLRTSIAKLPNISEVNIVQQTFSSPGRHTTGLLVNVRCKQKPTDYERTGTEIAAMIIKGDANTSQRDFITVDFVEGFSIGLANYTYRRPITHTPKEWAKL